MQKFNYLISVKNSVNYLQNFINFILDKIDKQTGNIQLSKKFIEHLTARFCANKEEINSFKTIYVSMLRDDICILIVVLKTEEIIELISGVNYTELAFTPITCPHHNVFRTVNIKDNKDYGIVLEFDFSFEFLILEWLKNMDEKYLKEIQYVTQSENVIYVGFFDKNIAKKYLDTMKKNHRVKYSYSRLTFVNKTN